MTEACVFCDIVAGNHPGSFVYEDDDVVAFLDLYPIHTGHTLIVPRRHVRDVATCDPGTAGKLFQVGTRIGPALAALLDAPGFNVWTANGAAAGQEVFHLHLHLLPRYYDDAFGLRFPQSYPREADRSELDALASRIRSVL